QFGDHWPANLGIIDRPIWVYWPANLGIIDRPIWGSFANQFGDHLPTNLGFFGRTMWGSLAGQVGDHLPVGIIYRPVQIFKVTGTTA
ncbi:MAG: hypothetical protein OIF58_08455, partial [Cohaesibacter sp.]|nr:hypothetical protein [Cohaesibacter sp.]